MLAIDLNCDMGEGFGTYKWGNDQELMKVITSANIACGFHAGDSTTMRKTVQLALENGVSIGAHPGLQDLIGFGRRNIEISAQEAYDITVYQIGALSAFVQSEGARLQHVKAHGALYNMASINKELAEAIAQAVYNIDPHLILFGLAHGELIQAGKKMGLRTASEVFADRTYQQNGTMTPRQDPDALIVDEDQAVQQVLHMVQEKKVRTIQGVDLNIEAQTICIHGDGNKALSFAQNIRQSLESAGVLVRSFST